MADDNRSKTPGGRSKLDEIMGRSSRPPETASAEEPREAFDNGRPWDFMLDVRFSNGGRCGFSYAYLVKIEHPSGDMIRLHFGSDIVTVSGRRLGSIYDAFLLHRPRFIQQGNMAEEWLKPGDAPHIASIIITSEERT